MSRLKKRYNSEVRPAIQKKFSIANVMQIPTLEKVVINMGIAEASKDKNAIQDHLQELALISGQKPVLTKARKSIAGFKLREGQEIGMKVTLRGTRMWDFIDRLVNVVLPRVPDFRGLKVSSDGNGNYTFGFPDQQMFPEINLDNVRHSQGMNITIVTSAKGHDECIELLRMLGMPFKDLEIVAAQEGV